MTHSDDQGLVLPPSLAPDQVVIVPIYRNEEQFEAVSSIAVSIVRSLRDKGIRVKFDDRDTHKPGFKFNEYELKGVPIRLAVGNRDLEKGTIEVARRDTLEKEFVPMDRVLDKIQELLVAIQTNIYQKAKNYQMNHITEANSYDEFKKLLKEKGGFIAAHWDGTKATEDQIKEDTKATIRCIPIDVEQEEGNCMITGKFSPHRVLFAKAY